MAWEPDSKVKTKATYIDETNNTKIVVNGFKEGAILPEPDAATGTITLTGDMLDTKGVSITTSKYISTSTTAAKPYRLVLDDGVTGIVTYKWTAPAVKDDAKEAGITVTYSCEYTSHYKMAGRNISYSKDKVTTKQNILTISGVNNQHFLGNEKDTDVSSKIYDLFTLTAGTTELNASAGALTDAISVVPKYDSTKGNIPALTKANMTVNTSNSALLLQGQKHSISLPEEYNGSTIVNQWSFNNATAVAYKQTKPLYYEDHSDDTKVNENTIKYTAAKTVNLATISGINKDFKTECENAVLKETFNSNGEGVTDTLFRTAIAADAASTDGAALAAAKTAYKKGLGNKSWDDLTIAQQTTLLTNAKNAYFKADDDAVKRAVDTQINTKISDPTENKITVHSDLFDKKNITISNGTPIGSKTKNSYALAFVDGDYDAETAKALTYAWSFDNANGTGASYKETCPLHYEIDDKGNIKYTAAKTAVLAKVAGINSSLKTIIENAEIAKLAETDNDDNVTKTGEEVLVTKPADLTEDSTEAEEKVYNARLAAYKAYNKSLYGKEEPTPEDITAKANTITIAKTATALTAAKTAYFKDAAIMTDVDTAIKNKLTGLGTGTTGTLTVAADALGTGNLTLTQGKALDAKDKTSYELKLGDDVPTSSTVDNVAYTDGDNNNYIWVVSGATAKLQLLKNDTSAAYYTIDKSKANPVIKYNKATTDTSAAGTLVTISGLKSGIVPSGTGDVSNFFEIKTTTDGENNTIQLPVIQINSTAVLGTADIKIVDNDGTNDWTLAFKDGLVADANKIYKPNYNDLTADNKPDCKVSYSKGTAKLIQTIDPGYTLSHDAKTIYYNVGTKNATKNPFGTKEVILAQVTGLAKDIADDDVATTIKYSFADSKTTTEEGSEPVTTYTNNPTITLAKAALNNTAISATGNGNFKLAFGSDVTEGADGKATVSGPALTLPNATAKFSQIATAGYTLDATGKKITYSNKAANETVLATISGFADLYNKLSKEAKDAVTATSMDSASGYPPDEIDESTATADEKTAYQTALDEYNDNKSYYDALNAAYTTYTAQAEGTSDANKLKAAQQAYIDSKANEVIVYDDDVFTLKGDALGSTNIVLNTKGDYTVVLDSTVNTEAPTPVLTWKVSGNTATYQEVTAAYYEPEDGAKAGKQITAHKEVVNTKNPPIKLTGINKDLDTSRDITLTYDQTDTSKITKVTLGQGALGTSAITMTTYSPAGTAKIAIADGIYGSEDAAKDSDAYKTGGWIVSGTTATYQKFTPAYYEVDTDYNKITYKAISGKGPALITITGLESGLTTDKDGKVDDDIIKLDGTTKTVTVKGAALGTKTNNKVTIKGTGDYENATLALGSDVTNVVDDYQFRYTSSAKTAVSLVAEAGYVCDGKTISYSDGSAPALLTLSGSVISPKLACNEDTLLITSDAIKLVAAVEGTETQTGGNNNNNDNNDGNNNNNDNNEEAGDTTGTTAATPTIIQIKAAALNEKAISLPATSGYTLALALDSDTAAVTATPTTKYTQSGTTVTIKQEFGPSGSASAAYGVDNTGKKINYYTSTQSTTLATVSGVEANLAAADLATAVKLESDGETITIGYAAIDETKHNEIKTSTKGYKLALDSTSFSGKTSTAGNPLLSYDSSTKKVTLAKKPSAGYLLNDDANSIKYYDGNTYAPALATISGLAVDASTLADYVKVGSMSGTEFVASDTNAGSVIQLAAGALGSSTVSLTGTGYKLALDTDVPQKSETEANNKFTDGWTISGTTASFFKEGTKAFYSLNTAETGITYTAAKGTGTATLTLKGLASGLVPDKDGKITGITYPVTDDSTKKQIQLDKRVLGTTDIEAPSGYTLKLVAYLDENEDSIKTDESKTTYEWAVNGTTVNLQEVVTQGYSASGNKVTYVKPKTTTVGTLTGYNPNIKTDAEYAAEAFVSTESNLASDANTNEYTAAQKAAYEAYQAKLPTSGTPTDAQIATALTAAKTAYVNTAMAATLTTYIPLTNASTNKALTVAAGALGTTDLKLGGSGGFTFATTGLTTEPQENVSAWIVNGTTATLNTNCKSEYFTAADSNKTLKYNAATTTADSVESITLTGIKSGLKSGKLSNFITTPTGTATEVGLTQAVLGTSTVSVSDGYTLALSKVTQSDISRGTTATPAAIKMTLTSNSATFTQEQTKGYVLSDDATEVSYISADRTATLAKISGITDIGATIQEEADDLTDGTISAATSESSDALQAAKAAYTTAIGEDAEDTEGALAAAKEAYYNTALDGDITFDKNGKNSATRGRNITLSNRAIGTVASGSKAVTLTSTEGYTIAAQTEADAATGTGLTDGYKWTVSGTNATYSYNTAAGNVNSSDGKKITYYAAGNSTDLVKITGFNKDATFGTDVKVVAPNAVGTGTEDDPAGKIIKLTENALKGTSTVKIATTDSGYKLTTDAVKTEINGKDWVITKASGKAEYISATKAYYKPDNATAPQSYTYTPAVAKTGDGIKADYTITGLKANGTYTADDFVLDNTTSPTKITLSETALSGVSASTPVTLAKADAESTVKLALGTGVTSTSVVDGDWVFSGTTATKNQTRAKGYELSSDGTKISYISSNQTQKLISISGIAKLDSITIPDEVSTYTKLEGYAGSDGDIKEALKAYKLALYETEEPTEAQKEAAAETEKTAAFAIAEEAYRKSKMTAALLFGTATGTTTITTPLTVGAAALGTTAFTVTGGKDVNGNTTAYTLALASGVSGQAGTPNAADGWLVTGTKAEYVSCVPAYYKVDGTKINYIARAKATGAPSQVVIDGVASGADLSSVSVPAASATTKVISLPIAALGTSTTKITTGDGYTLSYPADVAGTTDDTTGISYHTTNTIDPQWGQQGATSKLEMTQPAKSYLLSADGKSITYSSSDKTTTVATIGGLIGAPGFEDIRAKATSIAIAPTQIDRTKNAVTVDGEKYEFTFVSDYKGTTKVEQQTVTVDDGEGGTKEEQQNVTVVDAYAKITGGANADKITANGDILEIAGGKGNDTITLGNTSDSALKRTYGNAITFAAGDGDDVVVNFSTVDKIKTGVAASSIKVNRDGTNVVVEFGTNGANGKITLQGYSKTEDVKFIDSSNKEITTITTAKYTAPTSTTPDPNTRSLLYSDNYMETTPVLSSITEITADDYSVGNIEGAADLTKLTKEDTPIIASSK